MRTRFLLRGFSGKHAASFGLFFTRKEAEKFAAERLVGLEIIISKVEVAL